MSADWTRRLAAALGEDGLVRDDDGTVRGVRCAGIEPTRRAVEILARERVAFAPVGTSRPVDARVSIRAPAGVFDLWTGELVVRVGAATTLDELDGVLAPHGLELGLADGCAGTDTIGGVFAAGDRGLRGRVGESLRERTLACAYVDGAGRLRGSGSRVVKSVAGLDLTRLHHGARGSLGVLVELVVRVRARTRALAVVVSPSEREAIVDVLPRVRARTVDAVVETWIDAATSARLGLGAGGHLVVARESSRAGLDRWSEEVGGERRDPSFLRALGADRWRDGARTFRVTSATARRVVGADPGVIAAFDGVVVDLLAGEAWVRSHATRAGDATILLALGSAVFAEHGSSSPDLVPATDPVRARAMRRIREVFDPFALLPPPPMPTVSVREGACS